MTLGAAVVSALVVLFAVVGLVAGVVVPFLGREKPRKLGVFSVTALGKAPHGDGALAFALQNAIDRLEDSLAWGPLASVHDVAKRGFVVSIRPELTWLNGSGVVVAGETDLVTRTLFVGRDLAALCHELAHLCDADLSQTIDHTHDTWTKRGIMRAIDEWQTFMKGAR